jgi:hypothetical protein
VNSDEIDLWRGIANGLSPVEAANRLGISEARRLYLTDKWASEGVFEYGTTKNIGKIVSPQH